MQPPRQLHERRSRRRADDASGEARDRRAAGSGSGSQQLQLAGHQPHAKEGTARRRGFRGPAAPAGGFCFVAHPWLSLRPAVESRTKRQKSEQNAGLGCPCHQADLALRALQRERQLALVRADSDFDQLRLEYLKVRAPTIPGFGAPLVVNVDKEGRPHIAGERALRSYLAAALRLGGRSEFEAARTRVGLTPPTTLSLGKGRVVRLDRAGRPRDLVDDATAARTLAEARDALARFVEHVRLLVVQLDLELGDGPARALAHVRAELDSSPPLAELAPWIVETLEDRKRVRYRILAAVLLRVLTGFDVARHMSKARRDRVDDLVRDLRRFLRIPVSAPPAHDGRASEKSVTSWKEALDAVREGRHAYASLDEARRTRASAARTA